MLRILVLMFKFYRMSSSSDDSSLSPNNFSSLELDDGTQRQIILHLLSSRGGEPDDTQRQILVIRTPFCHPETIESGGTQDK